MSKLPRVAMIVAAAAVLGCHAGPAQPGPQSPAPAGSAALEARVAQLEATLAKNAEALEFLRRVLEQQKAQAEAREREEPAEDAMFAVDIADSVKAGQVEGAAGAPVTIVKAFDFACPYCYRVSTTLDELLKDYPGKLRVVYMNMVVHPTAKAAHLASCAAAKQGKYLEWKRAFWTKGFAAYAESRDEGKLGEANLLAIAKDVGLNVPKLKADMDSPACSARVDADQAELTKFHVNATPTFFINGKHVGGALPKAELARLIDQQLSLVASSGVPAADYYAKVVIGKGEKQFRSKLDPKPN